MGANEGPSYTTSEGGKQGDTEQTTCRSAFLNLPECLKTFPQQRNGKHEKEFCTSTCKDAYHKAAHEMGSEAIKKMNTPRRQHYAHYEDSERLQAMCEYLKREKGWRTAIEIMKGTGFKVQAVGSAASELRRNATERGIDCDVECDRSTNKYKYVPMPVAIKDQEEFFRVNTTGQVVNK